jgi:hypothetical protein
VSSFGRNDDFGGWERRVSASANTEILSCAQNDGSLFL